MSERETTMFVLYVFLRSGGGTRKNNAGFMTRARGLEIVFLLVRISLHVSKSQNVNACNIHLENYPIFSNVLLSENRIKRSIHALYVVFIISICRPLVQHTSARLGCSVSLIKTTPSNQAKIDVWHKSNHPSD